MKKKILIVDDEPGIRFSLKEDLQNDFEIDTAEDGYECIQKIKQGIIPDLIILDIMMPGISGWRTFDKIREHEYGKQVPIIFLTARSDDLAERAGRYLGDFFIEKPYDKNELLQGIKKVLHKNLNHEY